MHKGFHRPAGPSAKGVCEGLAVEAAGRVADVLLFPGFSFVTVILPRVV